MKALRAFLVSVPLVLLLGAATAYSQNDQRILPPDSRLPGLVRALLLEAGLAPPSLAGPYSHDELRQEVEKIDPERLSDAGRRTLRLVVEALEPVTIVRAEGFAGNLSVGTDLEVYLRSAEGTPRWEYDYPRASVLSIDFEAYAGDVAYGLLDFDLREEAFAHLQEGNVTNLPDDTGYIDTMFPYRALLSVGGEHWNLALGRDLFSWGPGRTGHLILGTEPSHYDFFRATGYWDIFKYTFGWISIQPWLTGAELARGLASGVEEYAKNLFLHRFEFVFFERLRFTITEGLMYGKRVPDLTLFNPFLILHNLYIWEYASSASSIEITVNPWRNFMLYGQFYMNQLTLQFEKDRFGAGTIPNATAWMFGGEGHIPLGPGLLFLGFEAAATDPWLYIREHPLISFHWRRRVTSNLLGAGVVVTEPIGYRWGPDSLVFGGWAAFTLPDFLRVDLSLTSVASGPQTVETPYAEGEDEAAMVPPTEPTERILLVVLDAEVTPFEWLEIGSRLSVESIQTYNHVPGAEYFDVQWVGRIGFRLDGLIHGEGGVNPAIPSRN